ncbi:MAG: sigma-70 family RNA polymerase sigma factor [Candidatus Nanopelagicales bacterium]
MGERESVTALVDGARSGDSRAWDTLVDRYLPLVSALIARHRLRGADAEDVNQTVWLSLVEHLDALREPEALPGWIATTTRNECLRWLRMHQRTTPVDPQAPSPFDAIGVDHEVDDDLLRAERHHALREALVELPEPRRELLTLLLADPPMPYGEISERLGIPVGSIGPTRARALETLRRSPALSAFGAAATHSALRRP